MQNRLIITAFQTLASCVLLSGLLFAPGCGRPAGQIFPSLQETRVWPEAPEQPRVRFVGMISTEEDLKHSVSWIQGLGELLFGKRQIAVLLNPYAVAFDRNRRLLIADTSAAVVHVFNLANRDYFQFDGIDNDGRLMTPVALAASADDIYVVDSKLHKVCVFNKQGKFMSSFGGDLLKRPSGIARSEKDGLTYVSDTARHVIVAFDNDGRFVKEVGRRGAEPGQFNFPTHLWIDRQDKLYVSDTLNYRIQVFSLEGRFLRAFGEHGDRPGYFAHPCGVATDSSGNIYVTDRQFENIQVFDGQGNILMAFGQEGANIGEFWLPAGIYIDEKDRIYVADSFNKRVQVFQFLERRGL